MARTTDLLAAWSLPLALGCGSGCDPAGCGYPWVVLEEGYYWADDWSGAGTSLAVGDVDADGLDEVLVGHYCQHPEENGCFYDPGGKTDWTSGALLLDAPFDGGRIEDGAVAFFGVPSHVDNSFGYDLALPGDLTGDGAADVVVWGDREDDDGAGEEGWHVFAGPFAEGAVVPPTDAVAVVADPSRVSECGSDCSGAVACSWDGDRRPDLCTTDGVARGPVEGDYTPEDLCAGFEARRVAAGDLDGDGEDELVVAQSAVLVGDLSTILVLRRGQACGEIDLVADAEATWTYAAPSPRDRLLAGADLDGDGRGEIVFAQAVWDANEGTHTPTAWVFDGDQGGVVADADIRFEFFDWGEPRIPIVAGDFDGDHALDLAIGMDGLWVNVFRGPLLPGVYSELDADALLTGCGRRRCRRTGGRMRRARQRGPRAEPL